MAELENAIITPFEKVFTVLPGGTSPSIRALYGGVGGYAVVTLVKPGFMYDAAGNPRPWALTAPDAADATLFPWWMGVLFPALLFGVFI